MSRDEQIGTLLAEMERVWGGMEVKQKLMNG